VGQFEDRPCHVGVGPALTCGHLPSTRSQTTVIARLDPAIHANNPAHAWLLDCRIKSGNDGERMTACKLTHYHQLTHVYEPKIACRLSLCSFQKRSLELLRYSENLQNSRILGVPQNSICSVNYVFHNIWLKLKPRFARPYPGLSRHGTDRRVASCASWRGSP